METDVEYHFYPWNVPIAKNAISNTIEVAALDQPATNEGKFGPDWEKSCKINYIAQLLDDFENYIFEIRTIQ